MECANSYTGARPSGCRRSLEVNLDAANSKRYFRINLNHLWAEKRAASSPSIDNIMGRPIGEDPCALLRQKLSFLLRVESQSFIQDLLWGRGAAQALYQWMTAPPESHLPVLHATSLATQGQGWGSYQSLSASRDSVSENDERNHGGSRRRHRSRALSNDVDAAVRALVCVMIKNNSLLTEAATFAK